MGMKPAFSFAMTMAPFDIKDTPHWFLETEPKSLRSPINGDIALKLGILLSGQWH
jgi:hypothetical protein